MGTSESSGGGTCLAGAWESMTDRPQDTGGHWVCRGREAWRTPGVRTRFEALEARNGGLRFFAGFPVPDMGPALRRC